MKRVYGYEIPYRMYTLRNPGPTSKVTAAQVRAASDRWDTEGLLEDIDTQWGTIPEGEALEGYGSD